MADVFISYKKEDAGRVVRIVEGLRAEGFSVWWDHGIAPGSQWDQTIQQELAAAKVVIAVWSEASVAAPWVKEEAGVGKSRGILLPIRIDDVEPPLGFGLIQAADLRGWNGDRTDQRFLHVLAAVGSVLKGEPPKGLEAPSPRRKASVAWIAAIVLGVGLLGAGLWFALNGGGVSVTASKTGDDYQVNAGAEYQTGPNQQASAPTTAPPATAPNSAPPAQSGPTPAEEQTFAQARTLRTKQAFQDYLIAYPNGTYADRVRDILLTCRTEQRESWIPGGTAQPVRGITMEATQSREIACAQARTMATRQADTNCRAITGNVGFRNGRPSVQEAQCTCTNGAAGWQCQIDMPARCDWEQRSVQPVEVCG